MQRGLIETASPVSYTHLGAVEQASFVEELAAASDEISGQVNNNTHRVKPVSYTHL